MPVPFTREILDAQDALSAAEREHGREHESLIPLLGTLADLCAEQSMDILAGEIRRRRDAIRAKVSGTDLVPDAYINDNTDFDAHLNEIWSQYGKESIDAVPHLTKLVDQWFGAFGSPQAVAVREHILAVQTAKLGPEHPDTIASMLSLGWCLDRLNEPICPRQEEVLRGALALQEKLYGADSPKLKPVLWALQHYFDPIEDRKTADYQQAHLFSRRTLQITEREFGSESLEFASDLVECSNSLHSIKNFSEAEAMLLHALKIREKQFGRDNLLVAEVLTSLAHIEYAVGNIDEADRILDEVVAIQLKYVAVSYESESGIMEVEWRAKDRKDVAKIEACHRRYLDACEQALGFDHERTNNARKVLQSFVVDQQRPDGEREEDYRGRLAAIENEYGPDHEQVAAALMSLACYLSPHVVGYTPEIEQLERRALELLLKRFHSGLKVDAVQLVSLLHGRAMHISTLAQFEEAESLYRQALAVCAAYKSTQESASLLRWEVMVLEALAWRCLQKGDKTEAQRFVVLRKYAMETADTDGATPAKQSQTTTSATSDETVMPLPPLDDTMLDHPTAQYWLGDMYRRGVIVKRDNAEAVQWLTKSANQGNANSQAALGWMHSRGLGIAPDDKTALAWFRAAADQGHSVAQNNLGWVVEHGLGCAPDDREAAKWYRSSAEQGNTRGKLHFGVMCRDGRGGARDLTRARELFQAAAEDGDADAAYELGALFENGNGVAEDRVQATKWYTAAAKRKHGGATEKLRILMPATAG